ncbi:DNA-binding transcriptional repressor AcrR, partial [Escherichia coli]|nr:DNA-binding transcriptional repressor AcrR [Escherichia coli]
MSTRLQNSATICATILPMLRRYIMRGYISGLMENWLFAPQS